MEKYLKLQLCARDLKCYGRDADVGFTLDWKKDAMRRDFTFNALYCDTDGNIYDYFNGLQDLKNKQLKFIQNADNRICEDYLRILRAFRFYALICENSEIDKSLLNSCQKYAHKIETLSGERIKTEMMKLLSYSNITNTLKLMQEYNILPYIGLCNISIPDTLSGYIENNTEMLAALIKCSTNPNECLKNVITRWKLSNSLSSELKQLVNNSIDIDENLEYHKKSIRLLTKPIYKSLLRISATLTKCDPNKIQKLDDIATKWVIPKFPLNGKDLIKHGIKKGKIISETLKYLTDYWEKNNYSSTKSELLYLIIKNNT